MGVAADPSTRPTSASINAPLAFTAAFICGGYRNSFVAATGIALSLDAFSECAAMFDSAGSGTPAVDSLSHRIREIVGRHLSVAPEKITESARFIEDLGADSLYIIELIIAFEEAFGCEIPDEVAESIVTVADARQYLEGKVKT